MKTRVTLGGWNDIPHIDVSIHRDWPHGKHRRHSPSKSSAYRIDALLLHPQMKYEFTSFADDSVNVFYTWNPTKGTHHE